NRLYQRCSARGVRRGDAGFGDDHVQRSDLHRARTDGGGGRTAVVVSWRQAAAQDVGPDREGTAGEGRNSAVAAQELRARARGNSMGNACLPTKVAEN